MLALSADAMLKPFGPAFAAGDRCARRLRSLVIQFELALEHADLLLLCIQALAQVRQFIGACVERRHRERAAQKDGTHVRA